MSARAILALSAFAWIVGVIALRLALTHDTARGERGEQR